MANKPPSIISAWLPVLSALALVCGLFISAGNLMARVNDHDRRITLIEGKNDAIGDKLDKINERTARIEAKLELIQPVPEGKAP